MPICGVWPVPTIWNARSPGFTVKSNAWLVGTVVTFLITSRPSPGPMMQSNGLLLPPLPADGYVQTLIRSAPDGRMLFAMLIAIVESFGQF